MLPGSRTACRAEGGEEALERRCVRGRRRPAVDVERGVRRSVAEEGLT